MSTKNLYTTSKTPINTYTKPTNKTLVTNQASRTASGPMPTGPTSLEHHVHALEQRAQQLEAQVAALLSVIEVGANGQSVKLRANKIEVDAWMDLSMKAGTDAKLIAGMRCELKGGTDATVHAGVKCELKGGSTAAVEGGAQVDLKGIVVKVNNGTKALAFAGDPVAGNQIVAGTSKVFA